MDELIGKYAYKKRGFYSYLVGVIEHNEDKRISVVCPYILRFKDGSGTGFRGEKDIVLVDDIDDKN